jgi:hypothetical protein
MFCFPIKGLVRAWPLGKVLATLGRSRTVSTRTAGPLPTRTAGPLPTRTVGPLPTRAAGPVATLGEPLCHRLQFLLVEHAILVGIASLNHASHPFRHFFLVQLAVLVLVVGQHSLDELLRAEATCLGLSPCTWLSWPSTGTRLSAGSLSPCARLSAGSLSPCARLPWPSTGTATSPGARCAELGHDFLSRELAVIVAV